MLAFKLKFNGKVNPKSFIDLPDRDSTSLFNSNKASSNIFNRNLNYLLTNLDVCNVVYLQTFSLLRLKRTLLADNVPRPILDLRRGMIKLSCVV